MNFKRRLAMMFVSLAVSLSFAACGPNFIKIDYDNLTSEEIVHAALPKNSETAESILAVFEANHVESIQSIEEYDHYKDRWFFEVPYYRITVYFKEGTDKEISSIQTDEKALYRDGELCEERMLSVQDNEVLTQHMLRTISSILDMEFADMKTLEPVSCRNLEKHEVYNGYEIDGEMVVMGYAQGQIGNRTQGLDFVAKYDTNYELTDLRITNLGILNISVLEYTNLSDQEEAPPVEEPPFQPVKVPYEVFLDEMDAFAAEEGIASLKFLPSAFHPEVNKYVFQLGNGKAISININDEENVSNIQFIIANTQKSENFENLPDDMAAYILHAGKILGPKDDLLTLYKSCSSGVVMGENVAIMVYNTAIEDTIAINIVVRGH